MTRFDARLRRLEQVSSAHCPGEYRIEVFHCRRGCEKNLPPPSDRCLRCGQVHPPADDGREQPIRRVILSYPTAGSESDGLGEQGWRESVSWRDREGRREDI
jgi:hypothetical protein